MRNVCIVFLEFSMKMLLHVMHPMFAGTEPVSVTDTNLNYAMNLEAKLGESVVIFCKSQGKPEPKTDWFKVSSAFILGC
jgi:hypothetical protein